MTVRIYYNPRCSKCRQTMSLLEENSVDAQIIEYLSDTPDVAELQQLMNALNITDARQMMRSGESAYKDNNLADERLSNDALLAAIVTNPILLERPIIVSGDRAVIGRPPENVLTLLKQA